MHRLIIGTVIIGALAIGTANLIDMDINKTAAPDEKNLAETEIMVENLEVVGSTLRLNYGVEVEELETIEEELEADETEQEGMEITDEDLEGTDYEYPSSAGSGTVSGSSSGGTSNQQQTNNQTTNQTTSNQTSTNSGGGSASGGYGGVYYIPPVEEETTEATTEATTEEELEAVWVVDVPEQVNTYPVYDTVYHDVCNSCGAIIDEGANEHILSTDCSSWTGDVPFTVQTGTYTEIIPEQGHWEYR